MSNPHTTQVIAVAAPPGGGKSTLVNALAGELTAHTLFYDDFEQVTRGSPDSILEDLRAGGDFSAIEIPGLAEAIAQIKNNGDQKWLVLETQLGRAHLPSKPYIDVQVWIDTPLDLALARNMRTFTERGIAQLEHAAKQLAWQKGYLDNYINVVRETLCIQKDIIAAQSDLVIDGTLNIEAQTEQVLKHIHTLSNTERGGH